MATGSASGVGTGLTWGRRYAVCEPEHFRVDYAINPWMDVSVAVDRDRALDQWHTMVATIEQAGGTTLRIPGLPETPDMVYAMNLGIVDGARVAGTSFRFAERRPEAAAARSWFAEQGFDVTRIGDDATAFEPGDAFLFGDALLVSAGPRTDVAAHHQLAREFDVRVATVEVIHPALYHLDLSFCPLDERRAIVAPSAWTAAGRRVVDNLVPEPLVLDDDEAATFAANSIVVDGTVIMPATTPLRVARQLEAWGFAVALVDVSEMHKGGGSVRCMTLPLDTTFDTARVPGGRVLDAQGERQPAGAAVPSQREQNAEAVELAV
ncbi:MAG: dimethylarginine dimethylaminohydrolase family protein [Actinomycetes bacterium]